MTGAQLTRLALLAVAACLWAPCSLAEPCPGSAVTTADAPLYRDVPQYVTGIGWRGTIIGQIKAGTAVRVCGEFPAEFGFSTAVWVQIAYRPGGSWLYGLVLKDSLKYPSSTIRTVPSANAGPLLAVFTAAQSTGADSSIPDDEASGPNPPPVVAASGQTAVPAGWSDLVRLYWPLFVALLLGMVVKVAVDLLDTWNTKDKRLAEHFRNGLIALLVSPVVFLGFLETGQFGAGTQTFVVLMLLAFQSGFFWQAILRRAQPS